MMILYYLVSIADILNNMIISIIINVLNLLIRIIYGDILFR